MHGHFATVRTHPETGERISRLLALDERRLGRPIAMEEAPLFSLVGLGPAGMAPRYRWQGLWY